MIVPEDQTEDRAQYIVRNTVVETPTEESIHSTISVKKKKKNLLGDSMV